MDLDRYIIMWLDLCASVGQLRNSSWVKMITAASFIKFPVLMAALIFMTKIALAGAEYCPLVVVSLICVSPEWYDSNWKLAATRLRLWFNWVLLWILHYNVIISSSTTTTTTVDGWRPSSSCSRSSANIKSLWLFECWRWECAWCRCLCV